MYISYNWLCDYLPHQINTTDLEKILTNIGLEVEEVNAFTSIEGGLKGLVVGKVLAIELIEGADKIKLTKVALVNKQGQEEVVDIVCGAPNVVKDALVIVARPGTTLYPKEGTAFTIKKAKIRGVTSYGMLCSKAEIGVGEESDGIIILDKDIAIGTAAAVVFEVYEDTVFKVNLTANRNDAMSHYGVCRDVCAYLSYKQNKLIRPTQPASKEIDVVNKPTHGVQLAIESSACSRYCIVEAKNIKVAPAPMWVQHRLMAIGQQPINNMVDFTNYVLHDIGQPLHAFDRQAITSDIIQVKQGVTSRFLTLDEQERIVHKDDLMICNDKEPMCMAGVFGGLQSGISSTTNTIIFESAFFDAQTIRQTSLRHNLRTEAATHFEKIVDIDQTVFALRRLAHLLAEIDVTISTPIVDVYPQENEKLTIIFSLSKLNGLAGKIYDIDNVKHLLMSLGYELTILDDDEYQVAVPRFKSGISCLQELLEEVIRIDGLDAIPISDYVSFPYRPIPKYMRHHVQQMLAIQLSGLGLYEVINNSIVDSNNYENFKDKATFVHLQNSVSKEHDLLRPTVMESGLKNVVFNLNRKRQGIKLFEFAKTYAREKQNAYKERNVLGIWLCDNWHLADWKTPATLINYQHIVSMVEIIARQMNIKNTSVELSQKTYFERVTSFSYDKTEWAFAGQVSDDYLKKLAIKDKVWYAEIDMDILLHLLNNKELIYQPISKFHDIKRDLAFFIDGSTPYQAIKQAIEALNLPNITAVELFDRYYNEKTKQCSLGIRMTFSSQDKTLTEQTCSKQVQKIMNMLEKEFAAEIRKM